MSSGNGQPVGEGGISSGNGQSADGGKLPSGDGTSGEELPLLILGTSDLAEGFEGYLAYEIDELVNANPWREDMEIHTLPVYKNIISHDENRIAQGADFDKMREVLLDTADRLGLDRKSLTITDDVPGQETQQSIREKFQSVGDSVPEGYFNPTRLTAETEGIKISVDQWLTAVAEFEPALELPEKYDFSQGTSYEALEKAARYLEKEYGGFIGMENPVLNISGGGYNIFFQQCYDVEFYEGSGDDVERILNYHFNRARFCGDEEGKLFLARRYTPELNLSGKVGDYPVITAEEAGKLLLKGNYVTSVPCEMPGEEYIRKVELIYQWGEWNEYYIPYYRFYVELPDMERDGMIRESGLKTYGAYYVPAVESGYIADMPVWDGSMN